jgi:hypothetical protein
MVFRMPRSIDGQEPQRADDDFLGILHDTDARFRNGQKLTPQPIHLIPIYPARAGEKLLRIYHMRPTHGMDNDLGALSGKPTRSARVIQVNMGQKDMSNVSGRKPLVGQ